MMGEPDMEGEDSAAPAAGGQMLKRRKTGSRILRKLSLSGNKKRESIIYKQMKNDAEEDGGEDDSLLDSSNVRFKRSIVQINRSNASTPVKSEPARPGLFERFRQSFRRGRSASTTPDCDPLESEDTAEVEEEDKENAFVEVAPMESSERQVDGEVDEEEEEDEIFSDGSVKDRTSYRFVSESANQTWKQRIYRSFRRTKKGSKTEGAMTPGEESPVQFKRRYSLPNFRRKKKSITYEAL